MEVLIQVHLYLTIVHLPIQIISTIHLYLAQLFCGAHYLSQGFQTLLYLPLKRIFEHIFHTSIHVM